ncbi:DUF3037 domain-containing protein [Knoellia aerolata]|uniref:DUF3037 domain-containing protein n=1 Tax=Knoellia aerolata DSM 18566 TaxID=1385519 RepID=A0A0A0JZ95_9MICO|nr:DUF3037 domain-containing protein [Knoellia aerolata]KGN42810.1 hypothetical protein N801_11725 [Knoellia aerolata DSM 18566]
MSAHPYQYVVLRCVPRVDRGECVNVGVVLFSQSAGFLGAACHVDETRLRALAPELDLDAVSASLAVVDDVCAGTDGGGRPRLPTPGKRFGWLSAPRSTVIQPSGVHGGTAEDPAAELRVLLDRLVR